eukprot:15363140-Ditylum_brightwellii.AAC.1
MADEEPNHVIIKVGQSITTEQLKCKEPDTLLKQFGALTNPMGDFSDKHANCKKYSTELRQR